MCFIVMFLTKRAEKSADETAVESAENAKLEAVAAPTII